MLEDAAKISRVIIATGYVDLRKGIDGLAQIIGACYNQNPFEQGTLFLFCGRRSERMKGLLWMTYFHGQLHSLMNATRGTAEKRFPFLPVADGLTLTFFGVLCSHLSFFSI